MPQADPAVLRVLDAYKAAVFVRFAAVDAAGAELRALHNRVSLALRAQGGGWRVVHEHTSAPLDFESTKAMLTR